MWAIGVTWEWTIVTQNRNSIGKNEYSRRLCALRRKCSSGESHHRPGQVFKLMSSIHLDYYSWLMAQQINIGKVNMSRTDKLLSYAKIYFLPVFFNVESIKL